MSGYRTKLETIHGSGADLVMRSLLDRMQYHDPDGEAERAGIAPASWPLFGVVWPSGQVLAGVMATIELGGLRILELGCGLGLASLVVHRRGGNITASDCHPLAPVFLAENLRLNSLPVMKYQAVNWNLPHPELGLFDLIIASDVLYDRGQPEPLSQFISRHSAGEVEVVVADPDRGNHAGFSRKMDALGYAHTRKRVIALPDGERYKGQVHRYTRQVDVEQV